MARGSRSPAIFPNPTRRASHWQSRCTAALWQLLGGLKTVLQKAEEHATSQKWVYHRGAESAALSRHVPARAAGAAGLHSSWGAGRVARISPAVIPRP